MPEKGIINTKQFIWLLFIIITSVSVTQIPSMLIFQAGRDAWLSVIGGWFLDVLLAIIYAYMGIRFPGENFVQYSISILGKYFGKAIGIIFPLFFLLVVAVFMQGLSLELNVAFLPDTPFNVILVSNFIVAAYIARKGIEVLARMTEVLGPMFLIGGLVMFFMVIPSVDLDRLKPQFDNGVAPFLAGSPFILTFFGICVMMAMFIPLCNRPEDGFLAKFSAVSMGALFIGLLIVFTTGIFGVEQAENLYGPGLMLARYIHFGHYLERIEVFWMLITVGAGIVSSAIMLWAFSLGIAQLAGLKAYQPLVYPGALLAMTLGMLAFPGRVQQANFIHYSFPVVAAFVESGLEIFLFVAALVLRKRGTP